MISRWLIFWRQLWLGLTRTPGFPPSVNWTLTDREQLAAFCRSESGRKLIVILRVGEIQHLTHGVGSADRFHCGIAWGWKSATDALANLSTLPAASPNRGNTDPFAAETPGELFDRLGGV
jgi:hypothetical protein